MMEEAVAELERAAERISDDPIILEHLGDARSSVGDDEGALEAWKRALELDPDNEALKKKTGDAE
jgi:tetratricopeptide (TPR) repeat protein